MNLAKTMISVCLLALLISGCSKQHGYEGEYKLEHSANIDGVDEAMTAVMALLGGNSTQLIVIGPDYIEADGRRTNYEKIYAKKSGSQSFLVLVANGEEQIWKIENNGQTLSQNAGLFQLKMQRVGDL